MVDEKVNWDRLLDEKLSESRQRRQDEKQAAAPAPGPEAAQKLLDKLRDAAENGTLMGTADSPVSAGARAVPASPPPTAVDQPAGGGNLTGGGPTRIERAYGAGQPGSGAAAGAPPVRPPLPPAAGPAQAARFPADVSAQYRHYHHRRRGRVSIHKIKRVAFWLLLLAILLTGIVLTFWPGLIKDLGLDQPDERLTPPIESLSPRERRKVNRDDSKARPEKTDRPGPEPETGPVNHKTATGSGVTDKPAPEVDQAKSTAPKLPELPRREKFDPDPEAPRTAADSGSPASGRSTTGNTGGTEKTPYRPQADKTDKSGDSASPPTEVTSGGTRASFRPIESAGDSGEERPGPVLWPPQEKEGKPSPPAPPELPAKIKGPNSAARGG